MSSAFSWNPYGVSSSTASPGPVAPTASITRRWVLIMVGAVSPDPMIVSSRGHRLRVRRAVRRSGRGAAAWRSWSPSSIGPNVVPGTPRPVTPGVRLAPRGRHRASPPEEQHRVGDVREPPRRSVLPEPAGARGGGDSRVSHGAMVPSSRTSKQASVPAMPDSGQSGCGRPQHRSMSAERRADERRAAPAPRRRRPSRGTGASSIVPPSTRPRPGAREAGGELDHDVAAPGLPDHDRPVEPVAGAPARAGRR